jgi:hypothetical protein
MFRKAVLSVAALGAFGAIALGAGGVAAAAPAAGNSGLIQSGINFAEPQGSQFVGDNPKVPCQRINLPTTGSIQFVSGKIRLFTNAKGCTGKSLLVTKDVKNLNVLGFGKSTFFTTGA